MPLQARINDTDITHFAEAVECTDRQTLPTSMFESLEVVVTVPELTDDLDEHAMSQAQTRSSRTAIRCAASASATARSAACSCATRSSAACRRGSPP